MNERAVLAGWFVLGVFLQANFLIRCRWKVGWTVFCAFFALFGLIRGKHESEYNAYVHVLLVVCFFAVAFLAGYMKDILPTVTDRTLLFYSLLFWFAQLSMPGSASGLHPFLMVLGLVPTLATAFIVFVDVTLGFFWKVVLYAWFLAILATLGVHQFSAHWLAVFLSPDASDWPGPGECILGGMASMYLMANLFYLCLLLPIPAKGQSFANRMKDWREFTDLLAHRFDDVRGGRLYAAVLLVGAGGILYLDMVKRWVEPAVLINGLLAAQCVAFMTMGMVTKPAVAEPAAAPAQFLRKRARKRGH